MSMIRRPDMAPLLKEQIMKVGDGRKRIIYGWMKSSHKPTGRLVKTLYGWKYKYQQAVGR